MGDCMNINTIMTLMNVDSNKKMYLIIGVICLLLMIAAFVFKKKSDK